MTSAAFIRLDFRQIETRLTKMHNADKSKHVIAVNIIIFICTTVAIHRQEHAMGGGLGGVGLGVHAIPQIQT